jgi:hypothetical protein
MRYLIITLMLFTLAACRERYGLPMEASRENLLVVEGNILNGDTTKIRLSRTSPIADRTLIVEKGASIQIEGEDNSLYQLTEAEPGLYLSDLLNLNRAVRYRLKILTGSKEYQSEWLNVIRTPEIDSVIWKRDNGVEISVASHGTGDEARYYKWDYDEVWEFHADYRSTAYFTFVLDERGNKRYQCIDVTRDGITYNSCIEAYCPPDGGCWNDSMYTCWKYQNSTNINIGSTAALSDNTVLASVRKIDNNAWELSHLYSILVKQTGLTREGYEFYKILKANSEGLGTIFDAQPSQMKTNLKCVTDPNETVIGFVDATTVTSKRLFISIRQLRDWYYFDEYTCTDTLTSSDIPYEEAVSAGMVPLKISTNKNPPHEITFYTITTRNCADCRLKGIHKRPDFWP